MERWARIFAVTVAGAMLAGPAFAQSGGAGSGGSNTMPPQSGTQQPSSGASKDAGGATSDTMKSSGKADKAEGAMKGAPGAKSGQVRAAQQALKDKGHDPGAVDGIMGPKTQAALRDFQKAEGIQTTGRLDAETMSKLGVPAGGRTSGTDTGSPAASPKTGGASDTSKAPEDKGAAPSKK